MKHAGAATLAALGPLLAALRARQALVERQPGNFYHKGRALLHFHDDPTGMFADLHEAEGWRRLAVNTSVEQSQLLAAVAALLRGQT